MRRVTSRLLAWPGESDPACASAHPGDAGPGRPGGSTVLGAPAPYGRIGADMADSCRHRGRIRRELGDGARRHGASCPGRVRPSPAAARTASAPAIAVDGRRHAAVLKGVTGFSTGALTAPSLPRSRLRDDCRGLHRDAPRTCAAASYLAAITQDAAGTGAAAATMPGTSTGEARLDRG